MSGLYNMMFGEHDHADMLLACLGFTKGDCGRYRSCYIDDGKIVIHTRNGGGNREEYQDTIDTLAEHPDYLYDEDDSFDCTYANIYFRFPEKHKEMLSALPNDETPSDKWQKLFEALKA